MNKSLKQHIAVIGLFTLFTLVMSLPVIFSLNNELIGDGGDPWQVLWRMDNRVDLLNEGIGTALKNEFGGGVPRLVNLSVWPWMWAHLIFGEPLGYNIIWLSSFILSGYGMYLLVNYLLNKQKKEIEEPKNNLSVITQQAPAFIAGLVYMLMPSHIAHSFGHFGAMQIQWIPLIILTLYMLIDKLTITRIVVFSILVTIQAWTEHHYMLWLGVFIVWLLFYSAKTKNKWRIQKKTLLYSLLVGTILTITVIIPYWPTVQLVTQSNSVIDLGDEQLIRFSADPLAYAVPAPLHPIWGNLSNTLFGQHFTGNPQESTLYLGLLPILLILFYHQKIPKQQKYFWFITAIIFWVISLGPKLHFMGYVTRIPLPYDLIDNLPIFSAVRTIVRAGIFVNVGIVILLAWVLKTQIKRTVSVVVIVLIVVIEFLFWPMPAMPFHIPLVYEQIKTMPGEAIIEIPTATNYLSASKALYGSNVHGKELINNIALERAVGAEAFKEVRSMPSLRQLLYLRTDHILEDRDDFLRQDMVETLFDVTNWLKVRQLVVHQDSLSAKQREAVIYLLENKAGLKRKVVEDSWLYEFSSANKGDGIFVTRDDGWKKVALNKEKNEIHTTIIDQAELTIYNGSKEDAVVQISWTINEADSNKLVIQTDADLIDDDDTLKQNSRIKVLVKPGKTDLKFVNTKTESIKIIEPIMNVLK